jgi:N-acetylneuraminic acid mutarotase
MKYCIFLLVAMVLLSLLACGGGSTPTLTSVTFTPNPWTWVNGAKVINQPGTYGTPVTAAPSNVPGAREQSISWTDASGNFWLFGGNGIDSTGSYGFLNDLWEYSGGQWTWVSGSDLANQLGTYGTEGTAAPNNVPGARNGGSSWIDASGNLWLFGGIFRDSGGQLELLNDVWKYSAGQWTWMGGSNTTDQPGTYGTQGTPGSGNIPGARNYAATWTDASGNFWLFGGSTFSSMATSAYLNDLWKYQP